MFEKVARLSEDFQKIENEKSKKVTKSLLKLENNEICGLYYRHIMIINDDRK